MKKIISVFFVLLFAPSAYSAEVAASEITYIAPWTSLVDIQLSSTGIDPEGCGQRDLYRIDLVNDSGAQAKLSVILAAFMSGKNVALSIGGCVGDRPKIQGVRLSK